MKKKLGITLLMAFLLLSLLLALTSCNCQHRDADDNSLCDMCGARFVDGKDVDDHVHNFPEGSTECSCGALKSSEGLEFELNADGKSCTVTGIGSFKGTNLVIDTYNNLPVTSIGDYAFSRCDSLVSITIGGSVTSIGDSSFYSCENLVSITVDEDNTAYKSIDENLYTKDGKTLVQYAIGKTATSFTIPDNVTSIGDYAFSSCDSLKYNEYDNAYYLSNSNNPHFALIKAKDYDITSCIINEQAKVVSGSAFSGCESLVSITVDEDNTAYKSIDGNLYTKDGKTLVQYAIGKTANSFTIPDSVTSIGDYAFSWCDSLESVTISNSVTSIGDEAFYGCGSLESVTIGDSVTSIGDEAFASCKNLVSITVDEDNTAYKSIDGNLYTKDGKTLVQYAIGKTATSFIFPDSVTSIGVRAFAYCYRLTSITIPDSVTSIGDEAFSWCGRLTSITIPDNVTSIGDEAFYGCGSLESVTIGDSVTSIGDEAFASCKNLVSITVDEDNTAYKSIDGNLYTKDGKTLVQYAIGKTATSFTIPDNVTSIGDYAFADSDSLESVTIGDSVTSIGDEAFYRCDSLESVTIGDSVTSIGDYAFYGCDSLTSITIPDSVTSIGVRAFYYCESLESVTIGDSVTSIGYGAFSDCVSLESIKYCGTEAEWNEISKGNDWNYNAGSCTMTYNYTDE